MNENGLGRKSSQSGQALSEFVVTVGLIVILMSAIKIFSRIASADEAQIAEARWLSFHCAYRSIYCNELPELHAAGSSLSEALSQKQVENGLFGETASAGVERRVSRSNFDAGASLLSRYTPHVIALRSPEEFASSFGINTRDDLFVAEVASTLQAKREESIVGLPQQIVLAPRRLALLLGDGSIAAGAGDEEATIERVKHSITLPGQSVLDAMLSMNELVRELLKSLGLETVQTKWSDRELKPIDRETLKPNNSNEDCRACIAAP